eukprot:SAG22_NODE_2138_length_2956_cov_3.059153_2_plen_174_part_00
MFTLEWWSFEVLALAAGSLGVTALAAHNVGLQVAPLSFMIALGVSVAANVRTGNLLGAGRLAEARRSGVLAGTIACAMAAVLAVLLQLLARPISRAFSEDKEVNDLATKTMPHVAVFIFFYFAQAVAQGVVRGCGKQGVGVAIVLLGNYLVAIPLSFYFALSKKYDMGLAGLW